MIKLRDKDMLGRVDIFRPSTYDDDTDTQSLERRSNNINFMYYVGYLRDILGVVKGDDGVYYLELDVAFHADYLVSDYFRPNDLTHHSEILLGSNHEEMLDFADTYEDEYYEEGVYDSVLRLPFITFTNSLQNPSDFLMPDIGNVYKSDPNVNVKLSAVEEYTRNFNNFTGGINFFADDNRDNLGAWIPIGSGYYIKTSDTLIKNNNAYLKYIKDTSWLGSPQDREPIRRKIMDTLKDINYTKVEITDDDGCVNTYPIRKVYYRDKEFPVLLNTVFYAVSGGFYHPFLDTTIDIFKIRYSSEITEHKEIMSITNRSLLEHVFNNPDMYMNELRLNDKIRLIK